MSIKRSTMHDLVGTLKESLAETIQRGDIVTVITFDNKLIQGWVHEVKLPLITVGLPNKNSWFFNILNNPSMHAKVKDAGCYEVPKKIIISHIDNVLPGIHKELIEL